MLYKKASEMKPTPIPHCMGGEGTVMMERLLDAPADMLGRAAPTCATRWHGA